MTYQSVNPYNGVILKSFDTFTDAQVETALAKAAACFDVWRRAEFTQRAAVASKVAARMRDRVDEFARLITLEMGKRIDEARSEVLLSAAIIDYYAKTPKRF